MEDLVREARQLAKTGRFTALDVQGMFTLGTEGSRIMALALMEGDLGLADFPTVLSAISDWKSAFKQFHALTVANMMVPSLAQQEPDELDSVLRNPGVEQSVSSDPSRAMLRQNILTRLQSLRTRPEPADPTGSADPTG